MSIRIELDGNMNGSGSGSVDDADRARAEAAAETLLRHHSVDAAYAEYLQQFGEYDDEAPMHGLARTWCQARDAAQSALTAGWATPTVILCSIFPA